MSILIIITGFTLSGILVGLMATATAPEGYEDESGFHFGNQSGASTVRHETLSRPAMPGPAGLSPRPA